MEYQNIIKPPTDTKRQQRKLKFSTQPLYNTNLKIPDMLPYIAPPNPYINTMIPSNNSSTPPSYNENRHTTMFKRHKSKKYPSPTNQFNLSPNPQYLYTPTTFTNIPNTDINHHLVHPKFISRIVRTNTAVHAQNIEANNTHSPTLHHDTTDQYTLPTYHTHTTKIPLLPLPNVPILSRLHNTLPYIYPQSTLPFASGENQLTQK